MLALIVGCMNADPAKKLTDVPSGKGFILRTSGGAAGKHKYSVFIPRDYTPSQKYPTIVFLHGIGESGSDGKKCTTVGLGPAIAQRNGNFPFIVVFPQTGWDWTTDRSDNIMMDALKDVEKNYSVDTSRVSLTGMSSGGKGVWALGAKHTDVFAALVPMAGYAYKDAVPKLKNMPVWALHNSGDFIVPVGGTRDMVKRLKAEGNPNVHYSEFKATGHNCWDAAYDQGDLLKWLQAQRLGGMASARGSDVIGRP
jgi:predicted peptidase